MKISREIIINGMSNNTEFELTGIEADRTFNEVQNRNDNDLVYATLRNNGYEDIEGIPEELVADMAKKFRNEINDLLAMTMENVVESYAEKLEGYKSKWKVFTKKVRVEVEKEYTIKAKNEEDADALWEKWFERNAQRVIDDLAYEMDTQDFDEDDPEEDNYCDPEDSDINEDNAMW